MEKIYSLPLLGSRQVIALSAFMIVLSFNGFSGSRNQKGAQKIV